MLFAKLVVPRRKIMMCEDRDDNMLLECADESGAAYLVTGDEELLRLRKFRKTRIITMRRFIEEFLSR